MSGFFLLVFAIRPGFGKLSLEDHNMDKNKWNRLTDEIQHFKEDSNGFELHCPGARAREAGNYSEENRGFVSTVFIE